MSGVDDTNAAFLELSGRRAILETARAHLAQGKIDKGAFALSDKSNACPSAMEEMGVEYRRQSPEHMRSAA